MEAGWKLRMHPVSRRVHHYDPGKGTRLISKTLIRQVLLENLAKKKARPRQARRLLIVPFKTKLL
jgi:hypothetical protein